MRPQRVALIGPLPPPYGGMANQTRQLAALLREEGVEVTLVQVNASYKPAWIAKARLVRAFFRLVPYCLALWRAGEQVTLFHIMANSGWSWHLFGVPAIVIGRLRGVNVVVNYRGGEAEKFFRRWFWAVGPVLQLAHVVVVPSGFLEQVFLKRGISVAIVPNIIDTSRFAASRPAHGPAAAPSPHLIVCRNLEPIYDVATALRAFARVAARFPGARMSIAGSGSEAENLQRLTSELGIEKCVTFTGSMNSRRMAELYRSATVMVNPSRADNMPISVLEALASRVPVVSTWVGGVPYLVEDGKTGLLVPPGDPAKMADALVRLLSDVPLRERLASQGSERVEQFTWPYVREHLFDAYGVASGRKEVRGGTKESV